MDNLGGLLRYPIDEIPFILLVLVIAFTFHEFAHAYVADKFGDPTPRSMGRVTLNPMVHLDVLGTILIFLLGFGWAKPVLIKRSNFRKPRLMGILVSFAGPLANLILAFLGFLLVYLLGYFGVFQSMNPGVHSASLLFLERFVQLNLVLFLFNLLPLPPLDGYRILQDFLPLRTRLVVQQYEQWVVFLFLLMFFIPPLYSSTLGQIFTLVGPLAGVMHNILQAIFGPVTIDLVS
ncbi:site-2 protease family protein [Paenibacillus aurantius]|uniref:site-2 protease family protein n=1 Tax=Paenibacillus aurantius TaxID=2918900 RepID=UPI0028EF5F85|nr:site-2 protease family protein [Paenibacillus aurantius]